MSNSKNIFFVRDVLIIFLSIFVAAMFVKTGVLTRVLVSAEELRLGGSFVAGLFFTSVFTTAPAIVTLGEIARTNSLFHMALLGAAGAMLGDLILFRFVRDKFSEHLLELLKHQGVGKRFRALLKLKYFKWLTFLVGSLIIASPLPDELGISLLGFSKVRFGVFALFSFVSNFAGILIIGLAARAL